MKFEPHPYQREAIRRIIDNKKYGLFLDMGLGKTIITLTAIESLMYDYCTVKKVLIIAPKKVAESTWQDEGHKWAHLHNLRFSTVMGTLSQRTAALRKGADCYIINRENVAWLMEYRSYRPEFDMLVVDESSSFKNPASKRFRALRKSMAFFERVVILTGTPSPNTLMDLWAQIYLLDGGERLGRTISAYRQSYFKPDKMNGYVVYSYKLKNNTSEDSIYARLKDVCMSLKASDYLTMPKRLDNVIHVNLPAKAKAEYDRMRKDMVLEFKGEDITAMNAAALSNKLQQLANGFIYTEIASIPVHTAKIDKLKEIVEANEGMPILVFYSFRQDAVALHRAFSYAKDLKGADTMRAWNAGRIRMMIAHPASCGYGLNLQAGGSIIVWYGLTWSLELYQQANARLYRQGQDKPVIIHHLVASGTVDESIMDAMKRKKHGQDALLDAIKAHLKEAV
jgi:SNF2 family DNA or RNA helicase